MLPQHLARLINIVAHDSKLTDLVCDKLDCLTKTITDQNFNPSADRLRELENFDLQLPAAPASSPNSSNSPPDNLSFLKGDTVEKERIRKRLSGFDSKRTEAWKTISDKFGIDVKRVALVEVAKYLSKKFGIPIDRDAKRRKDVLLKWFDDNWTSIQGQLDGLSIENDHLVVK